MRYFKAIAQENKPFIIWSLFANSLVELQALGLEDDPLIVKETSIPDNVYDVCPLKIVDGELVDRTVPEMEDFEAEYDTAVIISGQANIVEVLKTQTFAFDGQTFPMHDSARLIYETYETLGGNRKIITSDGQEYDLLDEEIENFMIAYRNELVNVIIA